MTMQRDANEIKTAVQQRYGSRARSHLAADRQGEVISLIEVGTADACCTPHALDETQITAVKAFYEDSTVGDMPASVTEAALGCGNPTAIAALHPGERVLDLGSGGGIDCFLAARAVGPSGYVLGVDMTDDILTLARRNAEKISVPNVEFRKGEIEELPIDDASVDVIISNCVINLSPDKDRVLQEAFRVLAPGGRFQVSDIVLTRKLNVEEEHFLSEWTGCVTGALHQDDFVAKLQAAGFRDVSVALSQSGRNGVHSANITAQKPA